MSIKVFNARLQSKYDSYQAWYTANPVLLSGEPCFITVPAETGAVNQEPAVLIKVGDGTTAWRDLPYVSALAANVHDWALSATKPTYSANEITGLSDYISGEIQDTDTQYKLEQDSTDAHILKLSSKPLGGDWTVVATITTADTVYDDTALKNRVGAVESAITTLNGDGTTAGSVTKKINDAIAALDLPNTYDPKGAADAKDAAIAAAKKAGDDAQDDVDALEAKVGTVPDGKTVVQMISDAQTAATYDDTQVKADIQANTNAIGVLNGSGEGSVDKKITDAFNDFSTKVTDDAVINSYKELIDWAATHGAEAAEMAGAITALKNILSGIGGEGESATVVAYVSAAIDALKIGDYAKAADLTAAVARIATLEGKAHEHANKTVLDGITSEKVAAWDAAEQNAKDYTDALEDELASVAKSGNVNDLAQTDGDYIVLNCGTATTVI